MPVRATAAGLLFTAYAAQLIYQAIPHPLTLVFGVTAAGLYFAIEFGRVERVGKIFLLLIVALAALVALGAENPGSTLRRAAESGLLLVSFIAALSTLRIAAASSALLRRCGQHLLAQPPRRSYAVLNVGAMLAAMVLLFGVVNLFGAMIASTTADALSKRRAMLAVLRGYAMMPAWSPLALPFALLSASYPDVDWLTVLPFGLATVAIIGTVGLVADRRDFPSAASVKIVSETGDPAHDLFRLVVLVLFLIALVGVGAWLAGWTMIRSVIVVVPLFAIVWLAVINRARSRPVQTARAVVESLATGVVSERSILAVMAGAGFCGVALGVFAPVELLSFWLTSVALPDWSVPFLIVAIFMLLGQVGFSPTLTFITLAVVIPDPEILGVSPEIYYAAILGVWGLASIGTPFSVPAMLTARLFGDTPAGVTYRWSPLYLIAAPLSVALLLALLTVAM